MTDLPEPLELPGPNGSVVPSTWRAQRATARLSAETVDRAAALARETGATPYMVLMAAFTVGELPVYCASVTWAARVVAPEVAVKLFD